MERIAHICIFTDQLTHCRLSVRRVPQGLIKTPRFRREPRGRAEPCGGVPRGADDLTVGLSTLGKAPPGPPFCPRAGNTSAVHTNGLFATIERAKSVRVK